MFDGKTGLFVGSVLSLLFGNVSFCNGLTTVGDAPFHDPETTDWPQPSVEGVLVQLKGLNKITGKVLTIEAAINEEIRFGTLHIKALRCLRTPPEDPPESVAFLEIHEEKTSSDMLPVFRGWMFSSSPTLSGPEHPVYDIWIKECSGKIEGSKSAISSLPKAVATEDKNPNTPYGNPDSEDSLPLINEKDIIDENPPVTPEATEIDQLNALHQGLGVPEDAHVDSPESHPDNHGAEFGQP